MTVTEVNRDYQDQADRINKAVEKFKLALNKYNSGITQTSHFEDTFTNGGYINLKVMSDITWKYNVADDTITVEKAIVRMDEGTPEKRDDYNATRFPSGFWDAVVAMKPDATLPTVYSTDGDGSPSFTAMDMMDTQALSNSNGGNILTDAVIKNNPLDYFAVMANENTRDVHYIKYSQEAMNTSYTVKRNSDGTFTLIKFADRYRSTHRDGSGDNASGKPTDPQYMFWTYIDKAVVVDPGPKPEKPNINYHFNSV